MFFICNANTGMLKSTQVVLVIGQLSQHKHHGKNADDATGVILAPQLLQGICLRMKCPRITK